MKFFANRIRYGGRITLIQEPIIKGTYISFNDDCVKYSYLQRGKIEPIYNCEPFSDKIWVAGDFERVGAIVENQRKVRYVAVHEDGELNCFVSKNHNPVMSLHASEDEIEIEPNTSCIVLEGEFALEDKIAKKFVMVLERDCPVVLKGKGKLVKVKF
jgi:hypothetical protein